MRNLCKHYETGPYTIHNSPLNRIIIEFMKFYFCPWLFNHLIFTSRNHTVWLEYLTMCGPFDEIFRVHVNNVNMNFRKSFRHEGKGGEFASTLLVRVESCKSILYKTTSQKFRQVPIAERVVRTQYLLLHMHCLLLASF